MFSRSFLSCANYSKKYCYSTYLRSVLAPELRTVVPFFKQSSPRFLPFFKFLKRSNFIPG